MKVATPIASSFLIYLTGLFASLVFFKKAKKFLYESRMALFAISLVLGFGFGVSAYLQTQQNVHAEIQSILESPNQPIGVGKGTFPGRVVWIHDTNAVNQTSANDYLSLDENTNQQEVNNMLSKAIRDLTGKGTDREAWNEIFKYYNRTHNRGNVGYTAGEKIVIKINLNNLGIGPAVDTSPKIVFAVLNQLVNVAGVPQIDISFGDPGRDVSDIFWTDIHPTFPIVKYWGSTSGRTPIVQSSKIEFYSSDGNIQNYLPQCYVDATYLINIPVFKEHHRAGVSLCSKNHFGTLLRFSSDGTAFPYHYSLPCTQGNDTVDNGGYGKYRIFVDFIGHKDLGGKTILYLIDGLWSSTNYGDPAWKWRMAPFNNSYPASIFVSQDPVAIESVGFDFLHNEFSAGNPSGNAFPQYSGVDDFLHQAADSVNWPSTIIYHPNGDGVRLPGSMGVHEHWNNATNKQYSRNLGKSEGIELISEEVVTAVDNAEQNSYADEFQIMQNYPNPFNPSTTITYSLPEQSKIDIIIYDVQGRVLRTFNRGVQSPGRQQIVWDGTNNRGNQLSSGIYLYRVKATSYDGKKIFDRSAKMLMMK